MAPKLNSPRKNRYLEPRRIRRKFVESKRRLSTLIQNLPGLAYRCRNDEQKSAEFVSEGIKEISGYEPAEFISQRIQWWKLIHEEDVAIARKKIQHALQHQEAFQLEYRIHHKDGSIRWVLDKGQGIVNDHGDVISTEGFVTDITDRKEFEIALKNRDAELELITQTTPVILIRCSRDLTFTVINSAGSTLYNLQKKDIIGRPIIDIMGEDDFSILKPYIDRVLRGETVEFTAAFHVPTGEKRWFRVNHVPDQNENGEVIGWIATIFDITENKNFEEALARSEQHYRAIVESQPAMLCRFRMDGEILFCNKAYADMYGAKPEDLEGKDFWKFISQNDANLVKKMLEKLNPGNPEICIENRIHTSEGERWTYWINRGLVFDEEGRCLEAQSSGIDVTERKLAEQSLTKLQQSLKESEEQYRRLLKILPVAVYSCNKNGEIIYYNNHAVNLWGRTPSVGDSAERFCGSNKMTKLDGTPVAMEDSPMAIALKEGKEIHQQEAVLIQPDGTKISVLINIDLIRDLKGNINGAIGVFHDISERISTEQRLKDSEQRYRLLNERLEDLVFERTTKLEEQARRLRLLTKELTETEQRERQAIAEILHDHIQQLIIASRMHLELLKKKNPDLKDDLDKVNRFTDEALNSCRSLSVELKPPMLFESGLWPALKFLARNMKEQYDLTVHIEEREEPLPIRDDFMKTMIYQSIREVLFNVIKHAQVDECQLSAFIGADQNIHIQIQDHGIGFDPETVAKTNQTSFGIFSLKERMHAVGGSLLIKSRPGEGAMYEFILPHKPQKIAQKRRSSDESSIYRQQELFSEGEMKNAKVARLMIVDDHHVVREGLRQLLNEDEYINIIGEAVNGEEAVKTALKMKPDIVLMDVNMPKMNGIEATRQLCRKMPNIKVIGLSIQNEEETAEAMVDAGAMAFFQKDNNSVHLIEMIRRLAGITVESQTKQEGQSDG